MATNPLDLSGSDLIVNNIYQGASTSGSAGTLVGDSFLTGITAGTAAASKAVVLGASKDIATITSATITTLTSSTVNTGAAGVTGLLTLGAAATTKSNKSAVTCSSNAATTTTQYTVVTTESLTTAHTASQAIVITLVGVASGDVAIATLNGGTNTQGVPILKTACTTDTITITILNAAIATNAFNGTFIINLQWLKA